MVVVCGALWCAVVSWWLRNAGSERGRKRVTDGINHTKRTPTEGRYRAIPIRTYIEREIKKCGGRVITMGLDCWAS